MKVGSVVVAHVAVLCVFGLTQGCVTSESQGDGRGPGARTKGPWKHQHKGNRTTETVVYPQDSAFDYAQDDSVIFTETDIIVTTDNSTPEPYVDNSASLTEIYIVQKGDMLSQLAVDFDTTVPNLVRLNGLSNPDVLYVGQELSVPAGRSGGKSTTYKSSGSVKKGGTYVIQKGDTLSEIALAAGVSIDDLRSLNNIKNDAIYADQKLSIPSYGKVPSSSRSSSSSYKKKSTPAPAAPEPAASSYIVEPPPTAPMMVEPAADTVVTETETITTTTTMEVDMVQDHVVYPGETLDDIARQHGASKSEIMRLNNITDENAIRESQRLRIPISEL